MNRLFLAPLAAAFVVAAPVSATTVSIDPITASWGNVVGAGSTLVTTGNGTDTPEIRWGNDAGNGLSGYRFAAAATPLNVNVVVDGASSLFNLGQFTHFNNPIFAPSITGAQLTITYGVSVGGVFQNNYNAVFDFTHDETTNNQNPCPFGVGTGVNVNGCADRVTISLNEGLSEFFTVGGVDYTLDISGFFVAGGGSATEFLTVEEKTNNANLLGRIAAEGFTGQGVPEPGSWAMMLLGFGAVGIAARRRQMVVAA